eukprot:403357993
MELLLHQSLAHYPNPLLTSPIDFFNQFLSSVDTAFKGIYKWSGFTFDANGTLIFAAVILYGYAIIETPNNIMLCFLSAIDDGYLQQYEWLKSVVELLTIIQVGFAFVAVILPVYLIGLGQENNSNNQLYYITPALTFNLGPQWLFYLYVQKLFQV